MLKFSIFVNFSNYKLKDVLVTVREKKVSTLVLLSI